MFVFQTKTKTPSHQASAVGGVSGTIGGVSGAELSHEGSPQISTASVQPSLAPLAGTYRVVSATDNSMCVKS